jgi:broad-specificity NMP kinase
LDSRATLFICGLPGAGKRTLAKHMEANADIAKPQHALNRLRIDLPLVHEPGLETLRQALQET